MLYSFYADYYKRIQKNSLPRKIMTQPALNEQDFNKISELFHSFTLSGAHDEILRRLAHFERDVAPFIKDKHNLALINWYKSRFLQETGHFARAEQLLDEALSILEQTTDKRLLRWKLKAYTSLGFVHAAQRNYRDVEFYLMQAVDLADSEPSLSKDRGKIYSFMGRIKLTLQAFSQARTYIVMEKETAYEEYVQDLSDDSSAAGIRYAHSLVNYARIHRLLDLADDGLKQCLKDARTLFKKFAHENGILRVQLEQAELECALKHHDRALAASLELKKIFLKKGLYQEAMEALLLSVRVYETMLEYYQAERKLNELLIVSKKHGLDQELALVDAFYQMGTIFYATNREDEAFEFFRQSAKLAMVLGINPLIMRAFNTARQIDKHRAEELLHVDLIYRDAAFVRKRCRQNIYPFASFKTKAKVFASTLFVNIAGLSSLIKRANDEQAIRMIDELIDRLCLIVYQNQGYIDTFQGDGFVAVFEHGHVAQGEAAFNAVMTGADIERALIHKNRKLRNVYGVGNDISVSMGVSTGEIYAIVLGNYVKREFTYLGNSVGLVSGLQDKGATPGMLIDDSTFRLVEDRVVSEPDTTALPPSEEGPIYRVSRLARTRERAV